MFYNYIKIAWRNLWKNRLFSVLNIMGLGIAIPFALLSLLQWRAAYEFDNFHPFPERIFRILTDEQLEGGGVTHYASSPVPLADELRQGYAGVEKATKVVRVFGWELNSGVKALNVNTLFVEPSFFEVFGFTLAKGTIPTAQNELVLSHEAAGRFFGVTEAIGATLWHPTYGGFKVTGVLRPYKKHTQFRSDVMVSMSSYMAKHPSAVAAQAWGEYDAHTFVRLRADARADALDAALGSIAEKHKPQLATAHKNNHYRRQALADISPSMEPLRFNPYVDNAEDIAFNFSIPVMILLLAGFNYVNMTLARSLSRSREVGIRKVVGAMRRQLVLQFVSEAVLIAFFALGIGMLLLTLMRRFIHVQWVTWEVENQTAIGLIFSIFTLLLGVLAGIFPAWVMSGFQPVKVIKGNLMPSSLGKVNLRKSLMVIQFVVTLVFVFMIGHMYNQFYYMATENDNFNRVGIFNLSLADTKAVDLLADEIAQHSKVEKVGMSSMAFGGPGAEYGIKAALDAENVMSYYYAVDWHFIDNMRLQFLAGENLPAEKRDSTSPFILLNEQAVTNLGLGTATEAIGKQVFMNDSIPLQVVGVVRDFCHNSYQFRKEPLVLHYAPVQFRLLSIKTTDDVHQEAFVADLQAIWRKHHPYQEMNYSWYQQDLYERYYPAEDMKMMGAASFVIFAIALMGLLGMVVYSTEKRIKEVGIRKTLGASVWEVVRQLAWGFAKLLMLAGLLAWPLGYLTGAFFNSVFTYNNGINLGLMSLIFGSILSIALLTVAYFSVRAALTNPVESLRSE
jgi:putative ABC transport system permease protein